jgi:1-deoxy-D-xylulose-5-phosphate synthase
MLTIEEGSIGGFGSQVIQSLSTAGLLDGKRLKFRSLFLPDVYIEHNTPKQMYAEAGLNAENILATVKSLM